MTVSNISKILLSLCLVLTISCADRKGKVTSHVSLDSLTGIKRVVKTESTGTGGGITGQGPSLIKNTVTKFDKNGKLIYESHRTTRCSGCLCSLSEWEVIAYNPDGSYQKLKLDGNSVLVQVFSPSHDLVSKSRTKHSEFIEPNWVDRGDRFF